MHTRVQLLFSVQVCNSFIHVLGQVLQPPLTPNGGVMSNASSQAFLAGANTCPLQMKYFCNYYQLAAQILRAQLDDI